MGKGKVAAQVGHVVQRITEHMVLNEKSEWTKYKLSGMAKIVLGTSQENLEMLMKKYGTIPPTTEKGTVPTFEMPKGPIAYVIDAGYTQIPPNTLTAIAICPMTKQDAVKKFPELESFKLF